MEYLIVFSVMAMMTAYVLIFSPAACSTRNCAQR